jgi:hypothetical protein
MEQNHNGQRWTYIMDFWQQLKGHTKIWVTKGRTPGSNVFIKIGNHLPRKLPRGCEFPKPPKPPTKCQTSYQLGAQLSITIGDMVIKDEQKKSDIKRLTLEQKYRSPGASEDEGNLGEDEIMRLPSAEQKKNGELKKGKIVYHPKDDNSMKVIPAGVKVPERIKVLSLTANIRCAGGSEIQDAHLIELKTNRYTHEEYLDACKPSEDHHDLWNDENDCRKESLKRALVSGWAYVIDVRESVTIQTFPKPILVVDCRMPKIRPGWPDISKRAYDGQYQSELCSRLYGAENSETGKGKRCGPFSRNRGGRRWKHCNYKAYKYCNANGKCEATQSEDQLKQWNWEGVKSPHCKVVDGPGGYLQELHHCTAPSTMEKIPGCKKGRGKLDLINLLKKCFRKELKKGGFTIEKVCTYQSVAKTFKNVGNLKAYIASNAIGKACIKHDADGNCTDYGYAPPLKLKCSPAQIMVDGIAAAKKNNCFWHPQDRVTNSLNAMKMLNKMKKKAYWLARMALVPGAPHLAKYLLGLARLTVSDCLWTDQPEEAKPKDSQECIKKVIQKSG